MSSLNSINKIKIDYYVHAKHVSPPNRPFALSALSSAAADSGYTTHQSRKNLTWWGWVWVVWVVFFPFCLVFFFNFKAVLL